MDTEDLRHVSKLLFGSKHRLEIAAAVAAARADGIYGRGIAELTGLADSQVWGELRRLEDAGLLDRLPRAEGTTQVHFRRRPSAYWEWIWEVAGEVGRPAVALERLLRGGESQTFEVSSSLFMPFGMWARRGREFESSVFARITMRKLVGFLNSGGGTLLIGAVEDEAYADDDDIARRLAAFPRIGTWVIVGLRDPTFVRHGWDRWERRFQAALARQVEPSPSPFIQIRLQELAGQPVCEVAVTGPQGADPYFLREREELVYYVRDGDRTPPLRGPEMARHWRQREHAQRQRVEELRPARRP